jgi:hypothetical protein
MKWAVGTWLVAFVFFRSSPLYLWFFRPFFPSASLPSPFDLASEGADAVGRAASPSETSSSPAPSLFTFAGRGLRMRSKRRTTFSIVSSFSRCRTISWCVVLGYFPSVSFSSLTSFSSSDRHLRCLLHGALPQRHNLAYRLRSHPLPPLHQFLPLFPFVMIFLSSLMHVF